MEELLYLEIPTPEIDRVRTWLQSEWKSVMGVIHAAVMARFSKFFGGNNPANCKAKVLSIPTVLNSCLDLEALLRVCGDKLPHLLGAIWDKTEFIRADVSGRETVVTSQHLTGKPKVACDRLLDAMGTEVIMPLPSMRALTSYLRVGSQIFTVFNPGSNLSPHGCGCIYSPLAIA